VREREERFDGRTKLSKTATEINYADFSVARFTGLRFLFDLPALAHADAFVISDDSKIKVDISDRIFTQFSTSQIVTFT
jgi:hypothetical protein